MTEYLIRGKGKNPRAHVWTGNDTVCRMWSTGGLRQSNYSVHSELGGLEICSMCRGAALERRPSECFSPIREDRNKPVAAEQTDAERWAEADRQDEEAGWEDRRRRIATAFSER